MAASPMVSQPAALANATESLSIWFGRMGIVWFTMLLICLIPLGSLRADGKESSKNVKKEDRAKRAFTEQRFPWYDGENDELVPLFPKKTVRAKNERPKSAGPEPELEAFSLGRLVSALLWLLLALVIAAAIFALIWYGQALIDRAPAPQKTEAVPEIESARLEALPEKVRGKGDLFEKARELAKAGNYSEAIAYLHGWQLIQLDKQGKIELQKGKTNRQYQGELSVALSGSAQEGSAAAELRNTFHHTTRLFEDAFYGHLDLSEEDFQSVWSKVALFERAFSRMGKAPREKAAKPRIAQHGAKAARVARSEKPSQRKGPPP